MALFAMAGKRLYKREALGWGDVKYLVMVSAFTGSPGVLFTILAGSIAGLLFNPLVNRLKGRKSRTLRFGPYLAAGTLIWLFAGTKLLGMYWEFCRVLMQK